MNRNRITYNERNTHLRQNANHAAAAVGPDCPAGLECCREIGGWNLRDLRDSARSGSGWREVPELELELCWPVRDLTTLPFKKKKKKQKFRDDFAAPPEVPQQGRGMERKVPDETHPLGVSKKYYFSSLAYSTESIRISKHLDNLLTKNATRSLSWRAQPANLAHRYKTFSMSLSKSLSLVGNYPFRISA